MLVLKLGGSVASVEPLLAGIASVASAGERLVLVHGASRALDDLSQRLGHPPRMVASVRGEVSRYTDSTTMDHFLMAYAGRANKRIVEGLRRLGVDAFGLCGLDGAVVSGRRRADLRIRDGSRVRLLHDNHVGSIERVDAGLLGALLDRGLTPVLTPPIAARDGTAINVDGDRLAAEVAIALAADRLFIFADTPGLLRDVDDPASRISRLTVEDAERLLPRIAGRARVKLTAAIDARRRGVGAVVIAAGGGEHPLVDALAGGGTWVR